MLNTSMVLVSMLCLYRPSNTLFSDEPVPATIVDLGDGAYDVIVKPTAGSGTYSVDVGLPDHDADVKAITVAPHSHLGSTPFDVKINLGDGTKTIG